MRWVYYRSMNIKSWRKRVSAVIGPPLIWALINLLWKTCRIQAVIGEEHLQKLLDENKPVIPCYWHQQQLFAVRYLLDTADARPAFKLGYLISPSSDGDIASKMFSGQGVKIIRGSATRGGAQALREIYQIIRQEGVSPIVTPDGPTGPIYQCKPGVAMLAQISRSPLVPIAYAASSAWQLRSWDRFLLPRPFARIVIAVGEPLVVNKDASNDGFQQTCQQVNDRLTNLAETCTQRLTALR